MLGSVKKLPRCAERMTKWSFFALHVQRKRQNHSEYNSLYFIEHFDFAIYGDVPDEYPLTSSTLLNNNIESFHGPKFSLSWWKKNRYNTFPDSLLGRKIIPLLSWFLKCILFSYQRNVSKNRLGTTIPSLLSGKRKSFFFFNSFIPTLKDKVKSLHKH